ncbi:hypothetical protein PTKIN_Ptkin02bG0131100 [Pterospermum kingtungense]
MCRGLQQGNTKRSCLKEGVSPDSDRASGSGLVNCELCNSRATLYCQADDAYLCRKCDKWVHEANFLALRHISFWLWGILLYHRGKIWKREIPEDDVRLVVYRITKVSEMFNVSHALLVLMLSNIDTIHEPDNS